MPDPLILNGRCSAVTDFSGKLEFIETGGRQARAALYLVLEWIVDDRPAWNTRHQWSNPNARYALSHRGVYHRAALGA